MKEHGIAGTVAPSEYNIPPEGDISCTAIEGMPTISNNKVLCSAYDVPPYIKHRTKLLPGVNVKLVLPVLEAETGRPMIDTNSFDRFMRGFRSENTSQ